MMMQGEDGGYILKNHMLLVPSRWMLDPNVYEAIEHDKKLIFKSIKEGWDASTNPEQFALNEVIQRIGSEIYAMPMFSKEFVEMTMNEIQNIKENSGFSVNEEEKPEARIEEFVLRHMCPGWHLSMMQLILAKINIIYSFLFGRPVVDGIVQLANYNPKGVNQTCWHHDNDSDVTMVCPLNTGAYKGGGTEFFNRGKIDPLPDGHALIFPAYGHLHRGITTESGDRYLFVFWLSKKILEE